MANFRKKCLKWYKNKFVQKSWSHREFADRKKLPMIVKLIERQKIEARSHQETEWTIKRKSMSLFFPNATVQPMNQGKRYLWYQKQ